MFGLTIEKLFVVALLATVIIGPRRLPDYASRLATLVRHLTARASDAARRVERETGVAALRDDWAELDPRQYDPRRIIREAWAASSTAGAVVPIPDDDVASVDADADADADADVEREIAGEWVTVGSSGHPRRVWVPTE
ncbi:Sec-independent protein translocase subunit TatA/TatB [Microbacterium sp. UFMG61]|uniref:Sec-independent protein translocase subunit TatA/TatB n=1 Tax=Microbacterium sp. UFMG61 TaxID=2745935 RepID=UPI001890AC1C|nr:Sec-independent protein translocase TatB [Microbacterium sp. UFMG61]